MMGMYLDDAKKRVASHGEKLTFLHNQYPRESRIVQSKERSNLSG